MEANLSSAELIILFQHRELVKKQILLIKEIQMLGYDVSEFILSMQNDLNDLSMEELDDFISEFKKGHCPIANKDRNN